MDSDLDCQSVALIKRHYSEANVSGFTSIDGVVSFSQIRALLLPESDVLEYGAGRGAAISEDPVPYRRHLQDLGKVCRSYEGCDIDSAVMDNPYLTRASMIAPDGRLPYADESFDVIVARSVWEHIVDPETAVSEMRRVLRPGGHICAMTPNSFGYIAIGARLFPNALHARVLRRIQPYRKTVDVFPTAYLMNRPLAIRRLFGTPFALHWYYVWAEPYYHANRPILFQLLKIFHQWAPRIFAPTLCVFLRKVNTAKANMKVALPA